MHTIWHQVYLQKNGNYSGCEDMTQADKKAQ